MLDYKLQLHQSVHATKAEDENAPQAFIKSLNWNLSVDIDDNIVLISVRSDCHSRRCLEFYHAPDSSSSFEND